MIDFKKITDKINLKEISNKIDLKMKKRHNLLIKMIIYIILKIQTF